MKKVSLLEFLQSLESYNKAYYDVSSKSGIRRIKCFNQLSDKDFVALVAKFGHKKEVKKIDNYFVWKSYDQFHGTCQYLCCIIKLTKAPSQIFA